MAARRTIESALALLVALVSGCTAPSRPPVVERSPIIGDERPARYLVQPKDSLYSVAWRYRLDHAAVARRNAIEPPYTIHPGQTLLLTRGPPVSRSTARPNTSTAKPTRPKVDPGWRWPVNATAQRGFGPGHTGVDYSLTGRHTVVAAAAGRLVYAGPGLGGFRHLLIVEHGGGYLSAYSLNVAPRAGEGDEVKAGARLADIRDSGATARRFHFEIRREGSSIDPRHVIGRPP